VQKNKSFLNQDQKSCTNSYVELKGYVGGKVPYETHKMELTSKLLNVNPHPSVLVYRTGHIKRQAPDFPPHFCDAVQTVFAFVTNHKKQSDTDGIFSNFALTYISSVAQSGYGTVFRSRITRN
jgi:hypothetical protein